MYETTEFHLQNLKIISRGVLQQYDFEFVECFILLCVWCF